MYAHVRDMIMLSCSPYECFSMATASGTEANYSIFLYVFYYFRIFVFWGVLGCSGYSGYFGYYLGMGLRNVVAIYRVVTSYAVTSKVPM